MFWQIMTFLVAALGVVGAIEISNYPPPAPDLTVMYSAPPANPYDEAVAASGLIEAYGDNISIGVQVEGVVESIHCTVGEQVEKNQLLFTLDSKVQQAKLEMAKTNVALAKAQLAKNVSQLSRLVAIKNSRAVSAEDRINKEHDVTINEMNVKNAEAQLRNAEEELEKTKIYAPQKGIILKMDLRKGEFANFYSNVSSNIHNAPVVLGRTDKLQLRADIDEYNAHRIRKNQEAIAYTKGIAQVAIPLTFARLEPCCVPKKSLTAAADERVDTRVLQVIYTFDAVPDFPIYVGQQVDIFINAPRIQHSCESHKKANKSGVDLQD